MNEILFENRFVRDKAAAKEIFGYWYYKRPLFIALYVYFGIFLLYCIWASLSGLISFGEVSFPILLVIFAAVIFGFSYRSQVNGMAKRDRELAGGGELVCEITVTDSEVIHVAAENRQSVGFDSIKNAVITKGYIMLITKAKFLYVLKKDSFSKGDAESFVAFLKEKGIKIKK